MSPTEMGIMNRMGVATETLSSSNPAIHSGVSTGIESLPRTAGLETVRPTLVMISPDLDGNTTSARYSLGTMDVQSWIGSISEIQETLNTLNNTAMSISTILVSAGFGPEVSRMASILRRTCPQAPLVGCGRNLFGHILPLTTKELPLTLYFDFVIRNNSEIPADRLMAAAGTSIQVFHTQRMPGTCRPILLDDPEKPLPELQHIPWTVKEAATQLQFNRQISQRIRDRYYADRFVVVAALPKSASSVIGSCVSVIQTGEKDNRGYGSYMLNNQDSDLRPEIVRDFPGGGVVKYHTPATGKNLKVLDMLGIRYLIILRDPADQLAATYAHTFNSVRDNTTGSTTLYEHICPLPRALFEASIPIDNAIDYLIRGGYLIHALSWIVDWLSFRNPQRSQVVRYEDFIEDRRSVLNSISRFLRGNDIDETLVTKCGQLADRYQERRTDAIRDGAKKYPRGWTGKIGTWKDYFSSENRKAYCAIVSDFLRYYPGASALLTIYPNLVSGNGC